MPDTFPRTPESIAEIGAGADGYASGSQPWKGTTPTFRPKPIRNSAMQTASSFAFIAMPACAASRERFSVPVMK